MGQAAVNLPDPLDATQPAKSPATDDLLSQLAGDEIDRLLSEADVERPPEELPNLESLPPVTLEPPISDGSTAPPAAEPSPLPPAESVALPTSPAPPSLLDSAARLEDPGTTLDQVAAQLLEETPATPWWLLPLVWLNAPLANCSQQTREIIGKIALATLINALAVLVYLLVFGHN